MKYLIPIIGEPLLKVDAGAHHPGAILTDKGFVVCDPLALDTAGQMLDPADPTERCILKRGHIHIRVKLHQRRTIPNPYFGLELKSGWLFILPFVDLPPESRLIFDQALPAGETISLTTVQPLQQVATAFKADQSRVARLQDALAHAGYASPLTLQPTRLHSSPVRIYSRSDMRPLPLPTGHKLAGILGNWSGETEVVEFTPRAGMEYD